MKEKNERTFKNNKNYDNITFCIMGQQVSYISKLKLLEVSTKKLQKFI